MNQLVAMFPGQGSQYVGMGKKLYEEQEEVRVLYEEAKEILGFDLYRMCCEGPESELQMTENAQPAILAASVAAYRIYRKDGGRLPEYGAGHSLGEISALCCAGVISFADAIRLVHLRGKWMQEAVPKGVGTMVAVAGISATKIEETCKQVSKESRMVVVSNYNAPSQTVISGHTGAIQEVSTLLKQDGAVVVPLKVSAPFHCSLMEPCAIKLREELEKITYREFEFPVVSNVTGEPYQEKEQVIDYLYQQITHPVLWQNSMKYLQLQGVDTAFEFGPRAVLKNLTGKNIPSMKAYCFENDYETICKVVVAWGKTKHTSYTKFFGKCLAAAVSTKNNAEYDDEYKKGVIEPYRELEKLASQAKENEALVTDEEVTKGISYIKSILKTKRVPESEQQDIMAELMNEV